MKKLIVLFLFTAASLIVFGEVTGNAFLQNQTDHSGIKIKFIPNSPTAVLDSTYTIADGSYSILLQPGVYYVIFSKAGYQTLNYNNGSSVLITLNYTLINATLIPGNIVYISGYLNGVMTADTTYIVTSDVYINNEDTLIIEPGTVIKFQFQCDLSVYGLLIAIGNEDNKILFTSELNNPNIPYWGYIYFQSAFNQKLEYCIIENGQGIEIDGYHLSIEACEFRFIYNPIYGYGNATILNSYFHNFSDIGIVAADYSNMTIRNNIFEINAPSPNNYIGIKAANATVIVENNQIFQTVTNQYATGIYLENSNAMVSNNIIRNLYCGIHSFSSSSGIIVNNNIINNYYIGLWIDESFGVTDWTIRSNNIVGNAVGLKALIDEPCDISFNNVWANDNNYNSSIPGIGQIFTVNNNGDPCDPYLNISLNPYFVDTTNYNFHVYEGSPVIDAGSNSTVISEFDLDGNPRILDGNGDGTELVDMGSYEVPVEFIPTTNFTAADSTCMDQTTIISYSGNAFDNVIYMWDFDGGIIESGSGQGPYQVYWDQHGFRTISLYVIFEGINSDTSQHIIKIKPIPEQPGIPIGPAELCQGSQNVEYITSGATYATSYDWNVTPQYAAYSITGSSVTAIIDWNPNYYGLALVSVNGFNSCGIGIVSEFLEVNLMQEDNVSVEITATANTICAGQAVTFVATPLNGGDNPSFLWQVNGSTVGSNNAVYITSDLENNDIVFCYVMSSAYCVASGWFISNFITVDVFDYPVVTIAPLPNDTTCITETITLNAGNPGCEYIWSTGESTQSIVVSNISGPSGGLQDYTVEVIKGGICSGYDTISVYFDPCTGIYNPPNSEVIKIYPNPASEMLNIELTGISQYINISILSPEGKLLQTLKASPLNYTIRQQLNLSELPKGIYLIKFENDYFVEVRKFVKE